MSVSTAAPWSEREISRVVGRIALFGRRGLAVDEAETVAERLVYRDRDRDDRRLCIECSNFQPSRNCRKKLPTTTNDQLVRCAGFTWQTP